MNQGIFVSSTMMWHAPLDELMRTAYECGFSGIEMWAQQFLCCGYEVPAPGGAVRPGDEDSRHELGPESVVPQRRRPAGLAGPGGRLHPPGGLSGCQRGHGAPRPHDHALLEGAEPAPSDRFPGTGGGIRQSGRRARFAGNHGKDPEGVRDGCSVHAVRDAGTVPVLPLYRRCGPLRQHGRSGRAGSGAAQCVEIPHQQPQGPDVPHGAG